MLQFERLEEILDRNLWWQLLWAMLFEIMAQVDIRILLVICQWLVSSTYQLQCDFAPAFIWSQLRASLYAELLQRVEYRFTDLRD
jgi:hypothetical protein